MIGETRKASKKSSLSILITIKKDFKNFSLSIPHRYCAKNAHFKKNEIMGKYSPFLTISEEKYPV